MADSFAYVTHYTDPMTGSEKKFMVAVNFKQNSVEMVSSIVYISYAPSFYCLTYSPLYIHIDARLICVCMCHQYRFFLSRIP